MQLINIITQSLRPDKKIWKVVPLVFLGSVLAMDERGIIFYLVLTWLG
jgi:hypothetical protein